MGNLIKFLAYLWPHFRQDNVACAATTGLGLVLIAYDNSIIAKWHKDELQLYLFWYSIYRVKRSQFPGKWNLPRGMSIPKINTEKGTSQAHKSWKTIWRNEGKFFCKLWVPSQTKLCYICTEWKNAASRANFKGKHQKETILGDEMGTYSAKKF